MKTATVRDLRNQYTSVLGWIDAGEEIVLTRRGKPIARIVPEKSVTIKKISWADAPEVTRDRTGERILNAEESSNLIHEAAGKW